jgi:hypothetical protein
VKPASLLNSLNRPSRLVPPAAKRLPLGTNLRQYQSKDKDACVAIYSKNEPGRFPRGFNKEFVQTLDSANYLKLVLCLEDRPVAIGGIGRFDGMFGSRNVWLLFGMVDPGLHGQGFGTALLLARLAALSEPSKPTNVLLSPVAGSLEFVARFGFAYQGEMPGRLSRFSVHAAVLDSDAWRTCREAVRDLGFAPEQLPAVPVVGRHGRA